MFKEILSRLQIEKLNEMQEASIQAAQKSKDILNSTAREVIGKDPTVINEPSSTEGAIDVTVITQKRKILISK